MENRATIERAEMSSDERHWRGAYAAALMIGGFDPIHAVDNAMAAEYDPSVTPDDAAADELEEWAHGGEA